MITKNTIGRIGAPGVLGASGTLGAIASLFRGRGLLFILSFLYIFIISISASAQAPLIGGNVYGGGNQANVDGSTKVTVLAGDIGVRPNDVQPDEGLANPRGKLFGGARMANIGGNTFVNIDTENATDYIIINEVYGGNDISGTIGTASAVGEPMPLVFAGNEDGVDDTWNIYVRLTTKTEGNYTAVEASAHNARLTGAIAAGTALTGTALTAVNALSGVSKTYTDGEEISAADADLYNASLPGAVTTSDANPAGKTYIGQLFGGGNGNYYYDSTTAGGKTTHNIYMKKGDTTPIATRVTDENDPGFVEPHVDKTYLDVQGGSIVYAYGGGDNVTVNEKTVIHVDNPSTVVNSITDARSIVAGLNDTGELLTGGRFLDMGINMGFSHPSSDAFQVGRFFGGNNQEDMAIRPTWNLQSGKIRNLYSGGNKGRMIHPNGIYLEIPETSTIKVDNVYGGCRMADVRPMTWNGSEYVDVDEVNNDIEGTFFPRNLAARVLIKGGNINNVYGGNDVRGRVYFGNAVGISATVHGDVYGGGNGAYPYTDNPDLADDPTYSDFYYNPTVELSAAGVTAESGFESVTALNLVRPNAEQVSLLLRGTESKPTIVQGSVYVGGNCASLLTDDTHSSLLHYPLAELKMGSYVRADKIYLGNNGEGMVTTNEEERDPVTNGLIRNEGVLRTMRNDVPGSSYKYSTINLLDHEQMHLYMRGVAMSHIPSFVTEDKKKLDRYDYIPYSSYVGSLFYGGNRGSMNYAGTNTIDFENKQIYLYNKLVAGCNNANVEATAYNHSYSGGILGSPAEQVEVTGKTEFQHQGSDRIVMNLSQIKVKPMRWDDTFEQILPGDPDVTSEGKLKAGEEYYATQLRSSAFIADGTETVSTTDTYYRLATKGTELVWNTAKWDVGEGDFVPIGIGGSADGTGTTYDNDRRLLNGNIYGGCYTSGHVNGNVVININNDLIDRSENFAEASEDDSGNLYISGARNSGVMLDAQGPDVMTIALTVFGAGYGKDTEIWGSTTVNHKKGYCFQIFGGGEAGIVGKSIGPSTEKDGYYDPEHPDNGYTTNGKLYVYDEDYSTTVHLNGVNEGYSELETGLPLPESEYLYAAGNEGDVCGDSHLYLGNGRTYDGFGGASNANILGATEVYIGYNGGFPWIRDNVYGGNDFGGTIIGKKNHLEKVRKANNKPLMYDFDSNDYSLAISSTFVKYIQGRVDSIFGGNYGEYDYKDRIFKEYTDDNGMPLVDGDGYPLFRFPHLDDNSFVYFQPADNTKNAGNVGYIFGGSQGIEGNVLMNNSMQEESYVLVDDNLTTYTDGEDIPPYGNVDIFGGGSYAGLGSKETKGGGRSVVDLYTGTFHNVYGGSSKEGLIGYTRVNVPEESVIKVNAIYGGGKGYDDDLVAARPYLAARFCDHYVTCVDYQSENARVDSGIYGGNQNRRVAFDTYVNIEAPVYRPNGWLTTIYGGGFGKECVSGRTNIYMNAGSDAYEVYGGGREGDVFNFTTLKQWLGLKFMTEYDGDPAGLATYVTDNVKEYASTLQGFKTYIQAEDLVKLPPSLPAYVDDMYDNVGSGTTPDKIDLVDPGDYFNTNVHIVQGGHVSGYAYGGGYGENAVVSGTTHVWLQGGTVDRDIYGGGQGGPVRDEYGLKSFTASTNVNIDGGSVRNVYGGGYLGHVGKHTGDITTSYNDDVLAESNVIIGLSAEDTPTNSSTYGDSDFDPDFSFHNGSPAVLRNVYGGGEGGSIYGKSNVIINSGNIGYRYQGYVAVPNGTELKVGDTYYTSDDGDGEFVATPNSTSNGSIYQIVYKEELDDGTPNAIEMAGNVFGGGYVVNSYVDDANVTMYGGTVRGSLYGGGEVGPIGRGTVRYKGDYTTGLVNGDARIFKAGKAHVKLFDGLVKRNIFGGGRGKDSWGGDGTLYMNAALKPTLDLKCKGAVFGQTEVDIYGGEVGTVEGVSLGYGNVFGAGDVGCVYSAYENSDGTFGIGRKPDNSRRYDGVYEGYYYKYEEGSYLTHTDGEMLLTEDCKVLVEPWCKANTDFTDGASNQHRAGEFVPTSVLNTLGNKSASAAEWAALSKANPNKDGIIIHNAVFAGGNTSPGSTEVYANTPTVFGNATATIHDVYNRDLISIGRGRVGGLYGDGNLTLVDGYRELNITNYGTDYHHITPEITLAQYNALPFREAAYYEIRYKCLTQCTDNTGKTYIPGSTITADELQAVFSNVTVGGQPMIQEDSGKPLPAYWEENGVCSRYAGRPMNTIQRADFCGIFGSRMVMQGAQDRVPEIVDYTNYTINRVREVSLNKKVSIRPEDATDSRNAEHGNYFGIYSVVNYLGALTSDVDFYNQTRTTDNTDETTYKCDANGLAYGANGASFANWKDQFPDDRRRNNGNSHNKVALASGVYLELTSEKGTGPGLYEKDWGYITGVVELDLINVQTGVGGGYVYAKNEHGTRGPSGKHQTLLTELNLNPTRAVTNKVFTYTNTATPNTQDEWETSGNFVHSTQTIIDDCYNIGGKYEVGKDPVPAHYWFIKGSVYVYDQYISAYTGSSNAYSEVVTIPLTITSASHGKMTLMNVMPNRYAYYSVNTDDVSAAMDDDDVIELREKEYSRNEAINYWDYSLLTNTEKKLFVEETYVVTADCTYGEGKSAVTYTAGTVLLPGNPNGSEPGTYYYLKKHAPKKDLDEEDEDVSTSPYVHHVDRNKDVEFDYVFRPSNNVSHNTGYILTYSIDNPGQWNTWYTPKSGSSLAGKKDSEQIKLLNEDNYEDGPTYTPNADGVYGQNAYTVGSIIPENVYLTYEGDSSNPTDYPGLRSHINAATNGTQASFYPAYIVTAEVLDTTNKKNIPQRFHKGATLSKEDYLIYAADGVTVVDSSKWVAIKGDVEPAYMVTSTLQLSSTEYIYRNTYMTADEKDDYYERFHYTEATDAEEAIAKEIKNCIVPAYYCTEPGNYGGNYYQTGHNYRGLQTWSSLSEEDRTHFTFNYDAFDLLIDPTYSRAEGVKYQYDSSAGSSAGAEANSAHYSLQTPIDYQATYKGSESLTYIADDDTEKTATNGTELSRTEYERLPNEQFHYAPITVSSATSTYYVVTETIVLGDMPYAAGQVISKETYDGMGTGDQEKVAALSFPSSGTYYYCRDPYTIPNDETGHAVTSVTGVTGSSVSGSYDKNTEVPRGLIISEATYSNLTNKQKNFAIHGLAPTETSTLYVSRFSDILDLSAEKIITVIYQYDYVESDMSGTHITPISERHVLNIHLNFMSGIPTVEDIQTPDIILPGTTITIPEPYVTPGAYEITGGGWKLFDNESDAESHINGVEYTPVSDPLYLYQNKHYMAYYAKTILGETYSNYVPVSVANYHDLKNVFEDSDHHYYIDHKDVIDKGIQPKIYINDYSGEQDGLDYLKNLYDLSLLTTTSTGVTAGKVTATGPLQNHNLLDVTRVGAGKNLEFFLRTDIEHTDPWTPIGTDDGTCFDGTLHGDGHHLSGLTNSLFNHLCGDVYNLGVSGSFSGAGVAETGRGYVENSWINTTGTPDGSVYAVFGSPSASNKPKQIVNCYYQEGKNYNTAAAAHGVATPKPQRAFYNGEVAYDLNGFYLYKRYSDKQAAPTSDDVKRKEEYQHYIIGTDNKPALQSVTYYAVNADNLYSSTGYLPAGAESESSYVVPMYVEDRFADGDFRYAAGTVPSSADERTYVVTVTENGVDTEKSRWFPIWPDDYIFFGQKLTYGYSKTDAHQDVPTAIARDNGRLSLNSDANRVYRAPAYFRPNTKDMSTAHFNPHAYLLAKSYDGTQDVYPGMTAIDFAGHYETKPVYGTYGLGTVEGLFYPPMLDDDGLIGITTRSSEKPSHSETQNLLAYAPAETSMDGYANKKTFDVLTAYFRDPIYTDFYDNANGYRLVGRVATSAINGHIVQSDLTATNDHLLVDKQDFSCPIEYSFDTGYLMWYQRIPDSYIVPEWSDDATPVRTTKGWEGISLPFTAELVTTDQKGEITHFYDGSDESENGTETKLGHEYWLRQYRDISDVTGADAIREALFTYPKKTDGAFPDKTRTSTFLWDYYYEAQLGHNQQDYHKDIYQGKYYSSERLYQDYSLLTVATPYIIGFPGDAYYEFDLSGMFVPTTTDDPNPAKLEQQTITFASNKGITIGISFDELAGGVTKNGYTFKPSYLNEELPAGNYVMNSDGNAYSVLSDVPESYTNDGGNTYTEAAFAEAGTLYTNAECTEEATSWTDGTTYYKRTSVIPSANETNKVTPSQFAFRPYFTAVTGSGAKEYKGLTRSIIFSKENLEMFHQEENDDISNTGNLIIKGKDGSIFVTSTLQYAKDITIVTAAGALIDRYTIQPGETRETKVTASGVYLVNRKKLSVKIRE